MADQSLSLDYTNLMSDTIGQEHGITPGELEELLPKARKIDTDLKEKRRQGKLPFYDLPYQYESVKEIEELAAGLKDEFENFVLIGIGGSALGPICLHTALNHSFHNLLCKSDRRGLRMFFLDNIDPDAVQELMEVIDPAKTVFNVITKSGSTAETASNFLILRSLLISKVGKEAHSRHIIATTDPRQGDMKAWAEAEGYRRLPIDPGVGGRFTIFSPVGLLAAAVSGIDIDGLLAGAAAMDRRCKNSNMMENPAYLNAALQYLADVKKGKAMSVMMPYSQSLKNVADWYRQLWAESLGKNLDLDGKPASVGPTPIKALGATDQHSQVQLYMEGPNNKVFTFLRVEHFRNRQPLERVPDQYSSTSYLAGHNLAELINCEQQATALALTGNRRPNCTISFPEVNPGTLGQLLYMLEVQTVFSGGLYHINPLNQPGVEAGKIATYALMGRPGYERQRKEIESRLSLKSRYRL